MRPLQDPDHLGRRAVRERSARLDESEWDAGIRLACEAHVFSDVEVFLPQGSRMSMGVVTDHEPLGARRGRLLTPADLETRVGPRLA